tara:strand:- start:1215 stop:1688 length:474 start_codon:yes stop_codon:yes gene_type:complete
MAVPASGTLSMQDIAQERLNSTYGSGNVSGPISMYNLVNGGNTGGAVTSGNNYPAVNTGCTPNPATRGSLQLTAVRDVMGSSSPITLYYSAGIGDASNLQLGHILYSNSNLTTPYNLICGLQTGDTGNSTRICDTGDVAGCIDTNSSGVITNLGGCN